MNDRDTDRHEELRQILLSLRRRVRRLTVAVALMALAMLLLAAYVLGDLMNYHGFETLLFGGVSVGSALLGFAFGWFVRRGAC